MTHPLTEERLAELEALERAATPGRWGAFEQRGETVLTWQDPNCPVNECVIAEFGFGAQSYHHASLAAALRYAAPDLFAEVRRLRAGLAAALPSVEHHLSLCDDGSEHHNRVAPILAECRALLGLEAPR